MHLEPSATPTHSHGTDTDPAIVRTSLCTSENSADLKLGTSENIRNNRSPVDGK